MSTNREEESKEMNNYSGENNNMIENDSTKKVLEQLGFDEWFQNRSDQLTGENFSVARIIEVNKNNYKVCDGQHDIFAELTGKFMFNIENSIDYPTVGDWVVVQCFDDFSMATIHDILPRKSLLKRKDPGKAVEFQLIAANIDYAFIMQSVDSNFDLNRLERYLVMANESKIQPIVVLSKTDLISSEELAEINEKIERFKNKYLFLPISNVDGDGINTLKNELNSGKTYCLLGSSGVGKTTLLNNLLGENKFDVNEVREKDDKGRHTTTKRQLVILESGNIFIDTPGMRELGNFAVDTGIEETFNEIDSFARQCRFTDCTHTNEESCAVMAAVEEGIIDGDSYNNFLKLKKESAHYEMSYLDKRRKDKAFGKQLKNYKKTMRKK
ncbi:MAG: ribosome small subunit-dependent GTPase A [Candidatus Electryonea clarkiae]|nr:ribosome small subunit-dependent GTPase A [Candidatus Electryonea clarkiae]MDP8287930.1 ribosome small subunit-dependent GTPase A [Candidatus Electryonea clarkiae]